MTPERENLAPGTLLASYRIVERIGTGGFSLIYLAVDEESGDEVVLKEYMPKRIAVRDALGCIAPAQPEFTEALWRGRRLFFQEVKAMASLHHPNILAVRDFFLANDTGYLVTRYQRGRNLWAYIRARQGGLSPTFLLEVFLPILDALALIHSHGLLHLDVKPSNIHLRHGHEPLLLDLGAVHQFDRGTNPGGQIVSAGFSPAEQYYRGGLLGPWSDVYAVGASMRACIEGRPPPPAVERQPQDRLKPMKRLYRKRYPLFLLESVDWSMAMDTSERPQSAAQLLAALRKFADSPSTAEPANDHHEPIAGGRIDSTSG
ncbi:serine/threonine protein kinase [Thioflavicoccus mobilis 8321]|uniref:Serine/threonine protein kinase n=1 Tax=Thioflavicoccus mobilis 8321 TaxID=765912 RepID=L0GUU2_9GAMM|nr:serine/threonine-protein kinase [Thioflavicoccus mobilis]AGA89592.1 serine/threonine protein kinase [Thioflavicoccus mobilis 8321]